MPFPWLTHLFRRRITIAVDLVRLLPGGENGGVKPAVFALLDWMGRTKGRKVRFFFVGNEATRSDLESLARPGDTIWCSHRTTADPEPGDGPDKVDFNRLLAAGVDLLYNPFGPDRLGEGRIPFVSLLIDLLHREVPDALPEVEVAHRERFFADACARAAAVQVVSDDVARRLVEGFGLPRDRLFRTWLPLQQIDVERAELESTVPAGPFFLYPANIWPHKNHRKLLEAFRGFLDRMPMDAESWSLVLTGSGPDTFDLLDPDILRLGLQDRVLRLGYLNRPEYLNTMRAAHALVYPSLNEGFGIPVLEAQQAGIPVACSNLGSLPEVAGDGAVLFDPRDLEDMATVLFRLATDDEIRKHLISRGRLNLERFDFETEANRFADRLYAEARTAQSERTIHEN
jgi:glycosyltransferase involved in cell wall biosynthesis